MFILNSTRFCILRKLSWICAKTHSPFNLFSSKNNGIPNFSCLATAMNCDMTKRRGRGAVGNEKVTTTSERVRGEWHWIPFAYWYKRILCENVMHNSVKSDWTCRLIIVSIAIGTAWIIICLLASSFVRFLCVKIYIPQKCLYCRAKCTVHA